MHPLYNIHYAIFALVVCFVMTYYFFAKKEVSNFQNKIFLALVFTCVIATFADLCACVMLNDRFWFPDGIIYFLETVYLFIRSTMAYLLCLYFLAVTGRIKARKPVFLLIYTIPVFFDIGLLVQNLFNKNIFYLSDGFYHNGWLYLPFALSSMMLYMIICVYISLRYKSAFTDFQTGVLILIVICSPTAAIFQYFFTTVNIEMFARTLMMHYILFSVENESDLMNVNTKVYNRRTFEKNLVKMLNSKRLYTIILIKICNVRSLISLLGVDLMNELMMNIADYLETLIVDRRFIYDCNHYTFAIVIDEDHLSYSKHITESINEKFNKDWTLNNYSIPMSVILGTINIPLDLRSFDSMMFLIDSTEEKLRNRVSFIKDHQLHFLQHESTVTTAIKKALEEQSFQVLYQPVWDFQRNCCHGAEAFVRLLDLDGNYIPNEEWLPIAEKTGLIREIGLFLMDKVCSFISEPVSKHIGLSGVVVNLSAAQCLQNDLPFLFKEILDFYGLRTERIYIDVCETSSLMNVNSAMHNLRNMYDMGFFLALDNYGTGHTDISSLFSMGFGTVKIDRSIFKKMNDSDSARIFLIHTVNMLKEMGFEVAVEGIETKEQHDFVEKLGVNYGQGFYYARPIIKEEFINCLKKLNNVKDF